LVTHDNYAEDKVCGIGRAEGLGGVVCRSVVFVDEAASIDEGTERPVG
jgi:hypothetical protein